MQSPSQQAQYAVLTDGYSGGPQQLAPFTPLHHLHLPLLSPQSQPYHPPAHLYHPTALQYSAPMPSNAAAVTENMMRYPAPPQPIAAPTPMLGGARQQQNKDVKRRTKTGCLTCRKRRIKCDESHPTCRNCDKSGRDCLGYDPIFKPHSAHPAIQPAPRSTTSSIASPTSPTAYTAPPQYPGFGASLDTSSLDPALTANDSPLFTSSRLLHPTVLLPARLVMPIPVDHLISLDHLPPQHQPRPEFSPNPAIPAHEIDDLFRLHFAQGLDKLFETNWYSSSGLAHVQQDPSLRGLITHCMEQFQSQDPSAVPHIQALEARLVWLLAIMPRQPLPSNVSTSDVDQPPPDLLQRIDTVEALLTGHYLPQDRIPPPPRSDEKDPLKFNEDEFWHQLATLTSLHDDDTSDPSIHQSIDDAFVGMRAILGMMENRDVLYSIAIARHFGGRHPDFHPRQQLAVTPSNAEELEKLEVARKFIEAEDQRGTTQVVQRICGLAIRCWALQRQP